MTKTAFVPIDNRPVCFQLPQMVVNQAKEHILYMPDIELIGDLTHSCNIEGIFNWLEKLKDIDILIIALDTIAYGGLIPSRRINDGIETILERIKRLETILKRLKVRVYAFSSIMRISNNNINEEEKEYWSEWGKKIFEYSYNFHKKGEVKTDIPSEILEDYFKTRKRNFEVNKYYIELKKLGIIDTLVFSKDDCAQYGLNVKEAKELEYLSKGEDNIFIKTGADEIPLVLLSRALNMEKGIKVCPIYTNPEFINKMSKYEDVSVKEAVENQIKLSGGIISNEKESNLIFIINNFEEEQGELVMGFDVPLFQGELNLSEKPYFIADIVNANGSDNNFVNKLLSKDINNLYGYAAWNTTSNSLGSVLSAALTYYGAKKRDKRAFYELQTVRFLDDWGYQANERDKIRNNINNLSNKILKKNMKRYEDILNKKFPIKKEISYYFPWNRFFEIGIRLA